MATGLALTLAAVNRRSGGDDIYAKTGYAPDPIAVGETAVSAYLSLARRIW